MVYNKDSGMTRSPALVYCLEIYLEQLLLQLLLVHHVQHNPIKQRLNLHLYAQERVFLFIQCFSCTAVFIVCIIFISHKALCGFNHIVFTQAKMLHIN